MAKYTHQFIEQGNGYPSVGDEVLVEGDGILPDDPDPTGDDRSASRECPGCGRIMSDREAREQRACNDCCEDGGP